METGSTNYISVLFNSSVSGCTVRACAAVQLWCCRVNLVVRLHKLINQLDIHLAMKVNRLWTRGSLEVI